MEHDVGTRLWQFHGGIVMPHEKRLSTTESIARADVPATLTVALDQHMGAPAEATVAAGDRVAKGERIGRVVERLGAPVHAPTSGTVRDVAAYPILDPWVNEGPCVVIDSDGEDRRASLEPIGDYTAAPPGALRERIYEAGIVGLGGAAFPSHVKLSPPPGSPIESLIINGAECEPYIACDEMLMIERARSVVAGARMMQRALECRDVVIAIEDRRAATHDALSEAVRRDGGGDLALRRVPSIYPEGGERQLIQMLTGREVPAGGLPQDLGLVCHNPHTAAAVHDAVRHGHPLVSRIVTVTGHGLRKPRNVEALIGTPVSELVQLAGGYTDDAARLVMGGPMMGFAAGDDSAGILKASNCLLALTAAEVEPAQPQMPCIRCMECVRVCPARLLPQQLYHHIRSDDLEGADALGLADCIECGCCAAVCPSHIPLVDYYRHGKAQQRLQEAERARAEHARQRHEARQRRLKRREAARESDREAKKRALKAHQTDEIQAAIERARKKH